MIAGTSTTDELHLRLHSLHCAYLQPGMSTPLSKNCFSCVAVWELARSAKRTALSVQLNAKAQ